MYWQPKHTNHALLLMAHKAARLLTAATQHMSTSKAQWSPVVAAIYEHPEYVHQITDQVLPKGSPLLNSTRGADLVQILAHKIILLDPVMVDSYTEFNIGQAPGSVPALLRWAWYDTYSFLQDGEQVREAFL